jgi:hypothetical protein
LSILALVIDIKIIFIVYFIELYCCDNLTICNTVSKFINNYLIMKFIFFFLKKLYL